MPPEIQEIIKKLNAEALRLGEEADKYRDSKNEEWLDHRLLLAKADGIYKAVNIITAEYIPL